MLQRVYQPLVILENHNMVLDQLRKQAPKVECLFSPHTQKTNSKKVSL